MASKDYLYCFYYNKNKRIYNLKYKETTKDEIYNYILKNVIKSKKKFNFNYLKFLIKLFEIKKEEIWHSILYKCLIFNTSINLQLIEPIEYLLGDLYDNNFIHEIIQQTSHNSNFYDINYYKYLFEKFSDNEERLNNNILKNLNPYNKFIYSKYGNYLYCIINNCKKIDKDIIDLFTQYFVIDFNQLLYSCISKDNIDWKLFEYIKNKKNIIKIPSDLIFRDLDYSKLFNNVKDKNIIKFLENYNEKLTKEDYNKKISKLAQDGNIKMVKFLLEYYPS